MPQAFSMIPCAVVAASRLVAFSRNSLCGRLAGDHHRGLETHPLVNRNRLSKQSFQPFGANARIRQSPINNEAFPILHLPWRLLKFEVPAREIPDDST